MGLLDNLLARNQGPVPTAVTPAHQYQYKNRWSMIGTVASGKSTVAAQIVLTAQTLQSQIPTFSCDVVENTSNILVDVSNLRRGRFPPKTTAYNKYATEAGLLMYWNEALGGRLSIGKKQMHIPFCDVAGEDLQAGIKGNTADINPAAYSQATKLKEYVRESDGLILIAPASKALMFKNDQQLESEEDMEFDPDVNLARLFGDIIDYRRKHNRPLKGVAIVITKWDLIKPYADELNMNIETNEGLNEFMNVCFPSTTMKINFLQKTWPTQVQFFPSFIDVERDGSGNIKRWDDGSPKIKVLDRRVPSYGGQWIVNLINFLGRFAV